MLWWRLHDPFSIYFLDKDENGGGGNGKNPDSDSDSDDSENENNKEKDSDKSDETDKNTDKEKEDKPAKFTAEQQKLVDKLVGDARTKEREKAKENSEKEKLEKQGEYEKLYNSEKAKAEKLEAENTALKEKLSSADSRTNREIDIAIKEWDKDLKTSDPGPENVDSRSKWFEQNKGIAARLSGTGPQRKAPDTEGGNNDNQRVDSKKQTSDFMRSRYSIPTFKDRE